MSVYLFSPPQRFFNEASDIFMLYFIKLYFPLFFFISNLLPYLTFPHTPCIFIFSWRWWAFQVGHAQIFFPHTFVPCLLVFFFWSYCSVSFLLPPLSRCVLFVVFLPTDSSDSDLELSMVRHQPEGLEQLQAQTQFTRKELQSLYRGFKNVGVFSLQKNLFIIIYN